MDAPVRTPFPAFRRARLAALAVCLFVAFPFAAAPLVAAPTAEGGSPDDAPDAESDPTDEGRPARPVRHAAPPPATRPAHRPAPDGPRPPVPPLVPANLRGPRHLRC